MDPMGYYWQALYVNLLNQVLEIRNDCARQMQELVERYDLNNDEERRNDTETDVAYAQTTTLENMVKNLEELVEGNAVVTALKLDIIHRQQVQGKIRYAAKILVPRPGSPLLREPRRE